MREITMPSTEAISGEVFFDSTRKKIVIEFDEPEWSGKVEDIHLGRREMLKKIGERAFRAIELFSQEFYERGDLVITAFPDKVAEMTVHIIL